MTDMVERVAVALANYDADLVDVPHIGSLREFRFDHDRDEYVRRARAVIPVVLNSMREPTPEMLEAGVYTDNWIELERHDAERCVKHVWHDMLAAFENALKPEEQS